MPPHETPQQDPHADLSARADGAPGAGMDPPRGALRDLGRRDMIALALGAGAVALLGGCSTSSPTRTATVGDPIPDSPTYRRFPSSPRRGVTPRMDPAPHPQTGISVIRRETWAAYGPNMRLANRMGHVRSITVHHDGMSPFYSTLFDDTAKRLESIRRAHVGQQWADIGYHYAVDPAGRIWEARPEALQGAHVKDRNENNLGILVIGNFERQTPTDAALRAVDNLVATKMDQYRISVDRVYTHRELARTACPGRHLQSHMQYARASGGSIVTAAARVARGEMLVAQA